MLHLPKLTGGPPLYQRRSKTMSSAGSGHETRSAMFTKEEILQSGVEVIYWVKTLKTQGNTTQTGVLFYQKKKSSHFFEGMLQMPNAQC